MLAGTNFWDVVMLAKVCQVLVEVLDPVPVRFVGNFGHLLHVNLLLLFHVASLGWCEVVVIRMWVPFLLSHLKSLPASLHIPVAKSFQVISL